MSDIVIAVLITRLRNHTPGSSERRKVGVRKQERFRSYYWVSLVTGWETVDLDVNPDGTDHEN
jgi:hypothetical protein